MKKIKLQQIIESRKLDSKEIAKELFPSHKYPILALNRILAGEAVLDADQISRLSAVTGLSIDQLYGSSWKTEQTTPGMITFSNDGYKAELDTKTWITKVYHNNSLFHESIICAGTIALSKYIETLNDLITKHSNDDKH